MIQVLRETHETPKYVEERLRAAGGINRYGEPLYRVVWGWNRLSWMGGKFTDRDENGTLIRETVQLRMEPKYPKVNRWHVEKWIAPEVYGSPKRWYSQTLEREDGISVPALGPYPERGEYELVFTLEKPNGEFQQLTSTIVERLAKSLEFSQNIPAAKRKAALFAREEKAEKDYVDWAVDAMESPAFSGVPFVGVMQVRAEQDKKRGIISNIKPFPFREKAWICNIGPVVFTHYFDYGQFIVEAPEEGEGYRMTAIEARVSPMDHGEMTKTETEIGALDIAHDLVRMCNDNFGQDGFVGLFVCESERPSNKELQTAHEKLRKYCEHFVGVADEEFSRSRSGQFIPDFARFAAKFINVEKPYGAITTAYEACPVCKKGISPETVKCPYCAAILNEDLARKYHLLPQEAPKAESKK
jgi:hypothetical protein